MRRSAPGSSQVLLPKHRDNWVSARPEPVINPQKAQRITSPRGARSSRVRRSPGWRGRVQLWTSPRKRTGGFSEFLRVQFEAAFPAVWGRLSLHSMETARAKMRLADEYDAAQDRGELTTRADNQHASSKPEEAVKASDLGLTHKQVHEARLIRDAERAQPGLIQRSLDAMVRP